MPSAPYDAVADWYEHEFLSRDDPIGVRDCLRQLLGPGTGVHAQQLRSLG